MKKLQTSDFQTLAKKYGYEVKALMAVCEVEADNTGFDSQGRIKLQFEPKHFSNYLKDLGIRHEISYKLDSKGYEQYMVTIGEITIVNGIETNGGEFAAFQLACQVNKEAAIKATSWGMGQILGKWYKLLDYATPSEMVLAFEESEFNQFKGMLDFISATPALKKALKEKDWSTFARFYNGPLFKKFKYDTRLQEAYQNAKV